MPKGLQDMIQIDKILEREEKRFKEYGCVCRDLTYGTAKHFTLSDRIKWRKTEKQFRSIAPLIELMSQRDKYTGEHSVRVALITYRICMLIEMSRYYRKMVTLSGYVHDVGKISVPDGILHKEGPLTDEEYEEMNIIHRTEPTCSANRQNIHTLLTVFYIIRSVGTARATPQELWANRYRSRQE